MIISYLKPYKCSPKNKQKRKKNLTSVSHNPTRIDIP